MKIYLSNEPTEGGTNTIELTSVDNSIYSHHVVLFNDDVNSFDHVEDCLMKICFKTKHEAKKNCTRSPRKRQISLLQREYGRVRDCWGKT